MKMTREIKEEKRWQWFVRGYHAIMIFMLTWLLIGSDEPKNATLWIVKGLNLIVLVMLIGALIYFEREHKNRLKSLKELENEKEN